MSCLVFSNESSNRCYENSCYYNKSAVNTYCESNHLKSDLECKAGSYVGTANVVQLAYELGKCHAKNIPGYASCAASKIGGYASHAACKAACYANRKINCGSGSCGGAKNMSQTIAWRLSSSHKFCWDVHIIFIFKTVLGRQTIHPKSNPYGKGWQTSIK